MQSTFPEDVRASKKVLEELSVVFQVGGVSPYYSHILLHTDSFQVADILKQNEFICWISSK